MEERANNGNGHVPSSAGTTTSASSNISDADTLRPSTERSEQSHAPPRGASEAGPQRDAPLSPQSEEGDVFHDAPDVVQQGSENVASGQQNAPTIQPQPRDNTTGSRPPDHQPMSYLFTDRDTATPASFPEVPELQPLTRDVKTSDQISIIIGPFIIILCDLAIPIMIYYIWLRDHPGPPKYRPEILGFSVLSFGLGELYILVVRVWRLIKYRDECAPLLSKHKWELDATSWVYATALICGLIPFIVSTNVGPAADRVIPQLFLCSPGVYMAYLWLWAVLTLVPFRLPVRVDSEPRGSRMRPIVYYAAEDFFAVDGWQKRDFRRRYRERYEASAMFRKMILELTLFWIAGIMLYLGCLSAIVWNTPFDVAFGLTLGLLFSWIITWAILTYMFVQLALDRERGWWIGQKSGAKAG